MGKNVKKPIEDSTVKISDPKKLGAMSKEYERNSNRLMKTAGPGCKSKKAAGVLIAHTLLNLWQVLLDSDECTGLVLAVCEATHTATVSFKLRKFKEPVLIELPWNLLEEIPKEESKP
jgi:hypothetical protein